jgi:ubiquinol-cytochrome c reductase core subunit 2
LVIAYGSTGAPSADLKALPHLLGGVSALKWTPGSTPLSLAADKVPGASAKAFLLPYSDASLFGVVVTAPTSEGVAAVAKDVAAAIKAAGSAKDEEVKRAVAKAKFADATALESSAGLIATAGASVGYNYSSRLTHVALLRFHPFARLFLCRSPKSLRVIDWQGETTTTQQR